MTFTDLVIHFDRCADELLSSVVLTRLYPQARIVRSREEAWTTPAPDRARLIFDDHQKTRRRATASSHKAHSA